MFKCESTCNEARETSVIDREAGVSARERKCRDEEASLHARWATVDAERVQVERQRAEVGNSSVDRYLCARAGNNLIIRIAVYETNRKVIISWFDLQYVYETD